MASEIYEVLLDAFGKDENGNIKKDKNGNAIVQKNYFELNGEKINYLESTSYRGTTRYYINTNNKLESVKKLCSPQEKIRFLFYYIPEFPEYIFSLEVIKIDYNITHIEFPDPSTIKKELGKGEEIIRFPPSPTGINKVNIVAIKIGPQTNRDYTALKHYIISSDNRTYNKVVRNMVDYVTLNSVQPLPENKTELPHNLLVSGAPGTGKSHYLEMQTQKAGGASYDEENKCYVIEDNSLISKIIATDKSGASSEEKQATAIKEYCNKFVTRVTFYEDYSYENFVGCYKPVPDEGTADIEYAGQKGHITDNRITYKFVSGPFIDTYIKAIQDPKYNYYLIIEEINRAKAASVFGDMFQLLDRKAGISEYEIKPDAALNDYLKEQLQDKYDERMKLPSNMYLWATMNSADQGVMPLDSAFKRRWAQMYMDINPQSGSRGDRLKMPLEGGMKSILWERLRSSINSVILNNGFDEDRCIGSWYFSEEEINQISEYFSKSENERINMVNPLIDKLLYYLRQDLFRRNPGLIFKEETENAPGLSMSDLRRRVRQGCSIDKILKVKLESLPLPEEDTNNQMSNDSGNASAN